ncbi:manganese-dependent inorganic pyrophosphatase [Candidatus Methanosphaera massiliense]|jgi:manganese-dependent inorganic pyrophosphatase|uniref:manganese-dependent inorganic pyrophosphatase n=1 Tax=Methanosphaera TaxID=2316 RepID=UPI00238041BD|nr:manganese-dependent inorganic pyrophosphatase [Candidatus Methanosphaera massiliense]MDD6285493.1 manganese-dependent inorganic pyrophosphatase [Methanobacteriaceae archaeon]MDE4078626.1 manganese-dependent inorganic pyrophosphatase [Candidatus Methanosphaera massiliense]
MEKTYVFGHKSPDTDTITSSIVMANLEQQLGNTEAKAYRLGNINKETEYVLNYLDLEAPELLEKIDDNANVILVDHNSPKESVDNLENAKIQKIIDHHKIAFNTSYPLYVRTEPVGCTETILYKLYQENNIEITKEIASLMLSAIISDTLLLKSPTTTEEDKEAVEQLSKIAEIDYEEYGLDMLKAGTDLSGFTIDEILQLDAKQIDFKDIKSIVNQVNTASIDDVMQMKDQLEKGMNKIIKEQDLDIFMLLITDIINSNSQVIALGKEAKLVEKAYNVKLEDNTVLLEGVVSRKKQVVPIMTENA